MCLYIQQIFFCSEIARENQNNRERHVILFYGMEPFLFNSELTQTSQANPFNFLTATYVRVSPGFKVCLSEYVSVFRSFYLSEIASEMGTDNENRCWYYTCWMICTLPHILIFSLNLRAITSNKSYLGTFFQLSNGFSPPDMSKTQLSGGKKRKFGFSMWLHINNIHRRKKKPTRQRNWYCNFIRLMDELKSICGFFNGSAEMK